MPDYIEELNEGQRNAVLYNDGPSLVIAGAGSGKTRVLTYKIKDEYKNMTLEEIYKAAKAAVKCDDPSTVGSKAGKYMDFVEYSFGDKNGSTAYVADDKDNGNRPGIYPEFKESWLNPKDIEIRVYNILDEWENLQMAKDLGYHTFFWSLAYVDWYQDRQPSKEEAFKKLLGRIHPGAIVLLHSTSSTNAAILDELLTSWEEMGYTFRSIDVLAAP